MAKAMREADPQLIPLMERFSKELETFAKRTSDDFARLPSVHNALAMWDRVGMNPNDPAILLVDVMALADARSCRGYTELAKLVGLLCNAVMAVAHVYSRAYEQSVDLRKEQGELKTQMLALAKSQAAILKTMESHTRLMGEQSKASFELVSVLTAQTTREKFIWAGVAFALVGGGAILGLVLSAIFRR